MYKVIKNKGKMTYAYQLGSNHIVIKELIEKHRICALGNGRYEIYSQEAVDGTGEIAVIGDWIKIDSKGYPYPNKKEYFEANHKHIKGDIFEQIPRPLVAWDAKLDMCSEVLFLIRKKEMIIDKKSSERRYTAELWGTIEVAAEDAMIVFYSISYDAAGNVINCDWNFVERGEFNRTYSIIG